MADFDFGGVTNTATNGINRPDNVATNQYGHATNWYGDGKNASNGSQVLNFYYDRKGIKAATAKKIFSQFASHRYMPQNTGKEYKISVYYNIYDRMPWTDGTWNKEGEKVFSDSFLKFGFLSNRDIADVNEYMYGTDGKGYPTNTYTSNGIRLLENELSSNKVSNKFSTFTAKLDLFGRTLDYTEDIELFHDEGTVMRYRNDLGELANMDYEDAIQLDLLATPNVMYSGPATSKVTLGDGIGEGAIDNITQTNAVEESYKINYELIQKIKDKMLKYRVPKHTSILTGSVKIGTTPIPPCYIAIVGSNIKLDLENMTRGATVYTRNYPFIPIERYAGQTSLLDGEIGSCNGIRFVYAEQLMRESGAGAPVDANYTGNLSYSGTLGNDAKFDVFPILIPGKDSFATIGLMGRDKIIFGHKAPSQRDTIDQYGVYGFFNYKFWYASIILRPERLLRVNVLASA